jgi:hypothetical protein
MRSSEFCRALVYANSVAFELRLDNGGFPRDYSLNPESQITDGNAAVRGKIAAIEIALSESIQVENRFAQGLAWDRTTVDARASDHEPAVYHGDSPKQLCSGNRRFLPGGTASNHDEVVMISIHESLRLRMVSKKGSPQRRSTLNLVVRHFLVKEATIDLQPVSSFCFVSFGLSECVGDQGFF